MGPPESRAEARAARAPWRSGTASCPRCQLFVAPANPHSAARGAATEFHAVSWPGRCFMSPMVFFALGLWVGGALGACLMGMLCSRDDADLDLRELEARPGPRRRRARALERTDVAIVLH